MPRIPYFDPADAVGPRAKKAYEKLPPLNLFRMLGHSGELLDGFTKLGGQLLNYGKLEPVLREIAIIRVGVLSKASYEITQHERIGKRVGMSDALIAAVHEGPDAAAFDDLQRLVMRFTDDVVLNVRASDATFEPLRARVSYHQLHELVMVIGYYMTVSRILETFDVELEDQPYEMTVDAGRNR
ncbi:MAG: carboxymuconolactone decarboxylase family protein [Phenylobacterium sp.]|uniref:carboxymuconolactone decarboxylase family protein n=1 Tax=Phenylobacterium sp. TaxID=1871053 RepID=UPI0027373ACB|nr:carboxymuconolactone decarboxylase family protein [Phenylobacterium sp.]MDP3173951.1 carboxymuconolactone decarboxylase family protein [Phenylobacterium sp.]